MRRISSLHISAPSSQLSAKNAMCMPVVLSGLDGLVNETFWDFGSQIGSQEADFSGLEVLATNFHGGCGPNGLPSTKLKSSKLYQTGRHEAELDALRKLFTY